MLRTIETGEIGRSKPWSSPLDPFSYPMSGATGYPKKFNISIPGMGNLEAMAHIWPSSSKKGPGYKLGGGAVSRRQGFYFYRNDRLIQGRGWLVEQLPR